MPIRSSLAIASLSSSNSSWIKRSRNARVPSSTRAGVCCTTMSNMRWNASTIACASSIARSLFLFIRQCPSRDDFHRTERRNVFLGRYTQFLEPARRRQNSRFQRSDCLVVGQHAFPQRLPDVVQMLRQDRHPLVEIFPQAAGLFRMSSQSLLPPAIGDGPEQRHERCRCGQDDSLRESLLNEPRVLFQRRPEKLFTR